MRIIIYTLFCFLLNVFIEVLNTLSPKYQTWIIDWFEIRNKSILNREFAGNTEKIFINEQPANGLYLGKLQYIKHEVTYSYTEKMNISQ